MATLLDEMKFRNVKSVVSILVDILDQKLPSFDNDTVLTPIPTTSRNIRIRGYDHMGLIVKLLAKKRNLRSVNLLQRKNNTTQHFAKSAQQRQEQAKSFFKVKGLVDKRLNYVIIDDIFTTGSTLKVAANSLRGKGATNISVVAIARQKYSSKGDDNRSPGKSLEPGKAVQSKLT